MAAMARGLRDEPLIMAASKMNFDGVNLAAVKLTYKILQSGLDNTTNIVSGVETMEVYVLYSNSIFHKRSLAKKLKATININDYEDDNAGVEGGRRKGPPIEEEDEPLKKAAQKSHGNVGPLIYTGDSILPLPKFGDYPTGGKSCAAPC